MEMPKIFESEYRFCQILWEKEPIGSGELAELCFQRLGWKKSTTYTVIKRLTERGVVRSEKAVVTSLVSREQMQEAESQEVVARSFSGSLPQFVAAFTRGRKLRPEEAEEIRRLIEEYHE
ncbi:MAG: BlaI/MecI/CopY family transcriptional regulator [Lachnospiraceae bacterium]|nr:BlaI/MecI/CopY family transcriptional regulator [Lachnospiraceae bacterium]